MCGGMIHHFINLDFASILAPMLNDREDGGRSDDGDGKCELVGTFSLFTQALLGILCISSLIIKRYYEYPIRRTWPVWFFDVLKQVIGALGVHVFNVILSIVKTRGVSFLLMMIQKVTNPDLGEDPIQEDPCDWYFLSIVFDCTIGVYILYLTFKVINWICKEVFRMTQIDSGQYGPDADKPSYIAFFKQLTIYFTSLMITKAIIYGIVEIFEVPLLWFTSHFLLYWLDEFPEEVEIFVVMFVVPIAMNCLQLILIDNFIQSQVIQKFNERAHADHLNSENICDEETESLVGSPRPATESPSVNELKKSVNKNISRQKNLYGSTDNV